MLGWVQTPELRAHFSQIVTRANEMMDGEGSLEPLVMRVCAGLLASELGMLDQRAGDVVGGGLNSVRVAERALAGPRNLYRRTRQAVAEQRDAEGVLRVAGAPKVIYEHEAHPVLITSRNVHTSNWGVRNLNQPQAVNFNFSLSGSAGLTYTDMVLLCANREDWTLTDAQLGEALLLLGNIHQEHLGVSFRNHHEGVGPALLRMFGESAPISVILSGRDHGYGGAFGRPSTDVAQNRFGVAAWVNDAAAEPVLWQSNAGQEWLAGEVEIDPNGVPTDGIAGNASRHTGLLSTYARNTSLPSNAARANVGLMNVYANPAAWANLAILMEHFGADDEMFERCFARLSILATGCFSNSALSLPTPIHERLYPYYLGMDNNVLQEAAVVDWYNRLSRRMVYLYSSRFLLEDEVQAIRGEPIAGAPLNAHVNYCAVVDAGGRGCDDENLVVLARDARRRVLGGNYFGTCGNHEHHVPKQGADGEFVVYDDANCESAIPRRPDVPAIPAVYFDGMPLHSVYSVLDRNGEMKNDVDVNDALAAVQATRLLHANDQAVRDVPVNLTEAYRDAIYQRRGDLAELEADLDGVQGQRQHRGLADYAFMRRFIDVRFRRCATLEEVMASDLVVEIAKMSFAEQYVLAFYMADKMSVVGGGAVAMTLTAALGLQPGRPLSVAVGANLQPPVSALRGGVVNSKLTAPVGFCAYRNLNEPVAAGIDRFLTLLSSGVASIPSGQRRLKTAISRPDFRERLTRGWLLECFRACAAQDVVARSHKVSVVTIVNELGYCGTDNAAFNTEAEMREQLVESGSLVGLVTKLRQDVIAKYNSLSKLPDAVENMVGATLLPALDAFGVVSNSNMIIWRSMHPIVRSVFSPVAATAVLPGGGVDQLRGLMNSSARSIMANLTAGAGVSMVTIIGKLNVCLNMCGMKVKAKVMRRYANIHNPSDIDEYEMLQFWTRCGVYFDHALTVGGSLLSHGYFDAIISSKDVVVESTRDVSTMGVMFGQPAAITPSSVRNTPILDLMETNRAQLGLLPRITEHSRYLYGNPAIHSKKTDTYSRLQRSQIAKVFGKMEARQTMRWDANVRVFLTGMRRWHCLDEANELFDSVESDGWAVWNPWSTAPGTLSRCQINQDTGAPTAIDLALNSLRMVAPFYSRSVETVASPYRATVPVQAMMRGPDTELLSADI
nr:hypothetical protein [Rhizoctonia solani RNA virus HN008]